MSAPGYSPAADTADRQLSAAVGIGARLVAEAIWSGDRCNWVGAEPLDLRNRNGARLALTYRALGPNLYAGSSGVALFLAQLCTTTGQDEFRPTALAAMRHAFSRREELDPHMRVAFYTGWSGMGVAALRTGLLLDDAEFVDVGTGLLREVCRLVEAVDGQDVESPGRPEFDLMSGMAGTVLALVLGHRYTGEDALAEAAATAAGWLLRTARKTRTGWSWHSFRIPAQRDLTGLSHGAAGVAIALIEAYRLTGEELFATAARNAMRYENRWLSVEEGDWPDFRRHTDAGRTRVYTPLWCTGAPGIALSRLYAYEQLGESQWRQDATTALATTERVTRQLLEGGGADYSLCHGLPGNAESFQQAGVILGADAGGRDIPSLVADHGLERNASTGTWPCGTHSEESPNLMLGLAGIGYFYLRLAAPQIPSLLLPVRWGR
ncbi:lanthionine synthetase LanC family protein [Nonomuraea endophytica]|uniref:Lantibiotic modifying enzyme n=1 Tax=Nonomuraea endophytica TaxID=714136 RepID=A0A7W8EMJ3_9ACTN|nr:lanthionine synthetase LanC family protein [Nonomuraea endophytica]MBB5085074.1 lantibiotic modifying enzyme [Nonomuraea endophytica]